LGQTYLSFLSLSPPFFFLSFFPFPFFFIFPPFYPFSSVPLPLPLVTLKSVCFLQPCPSPFFHQMISPIFTRIHFFPPPPHNPLGPRPLFSLPLSVCDIPLVSKYLAATPFSFLPPVFPSQIGSSFFSLFQNFFPPPHHPPFFFFFWQNPMESLLSLFFDPLFTCLPLFITESFFSFFFPIFFFFLFFFSPFFPFPSF